LARKILLADDSVTAQNMGRKILADAGYEVITVNNGSAALKKVSEVKPDLIVLDVYMPGYSGLEVCQRLKEANETARIPILLTVGKLEPFKPEEAKRARADAFIVKPFEASELLSALSKMEDKIVPRPEPYKPGRFARAIAAVEEGRYDKSVAADDDTGWKHRIQFPSAKKEKPAQEKELDTDEFYNPMNKDLRTTVEHPAAHRAERAKQESPRVDLGALSPEGLPKDVTPEEIAALAAAAAQMKGTAGAKPEPEGPAAEAQATENRAAADRPAEDRPAETRPVETRPAEARTVEDRPVEDRPVEDHPVEDRPAEIQVTPPPAIEPAPPVAISAEAAVEEKVEAKPEAPAAEMPKEAAASESVVAAGAEQEAEQKEKAEPPAEKPSEAALPSRVRGLPPPISADLTGAIMALPLGTYVSLAPASGNGSGNGSGADADEPMTMAAATGEEFANPSRWMAVPVALLPEESAVSLDQEMQQAHAALAAAETAHAAPQEAVALAEPVAPVAEPLAAATPVETPVDTAAEPTAPEAPAPAPPMPEAVEPASSVASAAKEAFKAAVKEFETVAASLLGTKHEAPPEPEPAPAPPAEPVAETAAPAVETKVEEQPVAESAPEPEAAPVQEAPQAVPQEQQAEEKQKEDKQKEDKQEEPQPAEEAVAAAPAAAAEESSSTEKPYEEAPAGAREVSAEPASASAPSPQTTEVSAEAEPAAGGIDEMAKKEKEIAANTAAAWASWRRIRDTGDAKGRPSSEPPAKAAEQAPAPQDQDEAAMAVAAGAEKAPEEVPAESGSESAEIASIVDSVLADLRPKIVAEISKKLAKKK